jgi:hypothetical protein
MSWTPKYTKLYSDGQLIQRTVQRTENGPIEILPLDDQDNKLVEYEALIRDLTEALRVLPERNDTLEEVAQEFDRMPAFGDTAASFAAYVRGMKK